MTATVRELTPESPELEDVLEAIAATARTLDAEVYLVGGFVRDRLLGVSQGKDIDLVVVGRDPMPLLAAVASGFGWHPPERFERFGTAQIRGGTWIVEGVRARRERYDPESRRPDVHPGTLAEDVWRRDFTVNALCQSLDGEVIDLTGQGLADLVAGVLRTPLDPAETFAEDPLRMYRAARFVARLGFALAPGTLDAMRAQAARTSILSVERVSDEIRRMLVAPHPSAGIAVLRDAGLLEFVLPELLAAIGVEQGGYHTHDVYGHTVETVDNAPPDLVTRTAALLHDIAKPTTHVVAPDGRHTFYDHPQIGAEMARSILTRWRFSNDEIDDVSRLVRLHLRPIQYERESFGDAAVRRLIRDAGPLRGRLLDLARADTNASAYPTLDELGELDARMARLDAGGAVSEMTDPLSGEELMTLAGRGPGPWVGRAKAAIREAVIEGTIPPGDGARARDWVETHRAILRGD
ncbi:MAG TPA: CCA tRNA nucleotidyltransferase [Candidatus Saccharimonadales bacterium]|nr:CCA tRNA nucleotidyltransferase [Candidatus Saccharimonadales bacterium]